MTDTSTGGTVQELWERSVFSPVPVRNAFEVTVERLAHGIRLGVLLDGHRLPPERELAERLGVSRVTLREAIKALREAGLVDSRRGRSGGTFVLAPPLPHDGGTAEVDRSSPAAVNDVLDLRRIIEPGAAFLAATRTLSAADRGTLHDCLLDSVECPPEARRLADSRLHMAIAAAGESPMVAAVVADVQIEMSRVLAQIPVLPANISHSDSQHAAIVQAILGGQADRAKSEMEEHVDATAALLRGLLC